MRAFILLTNLFLCVGCGATLDTSRTYEAPRADIEAAPRAALLDAVSTNAADQGWALVRSDRRAGVVEATAPIEALGDRELRERWTFEVGAGWVKASVRREVRRGEGAWRSTDALCESYAYRAERIQLARVDAIVSGGDAAMAALIVL